MFISVVVAIRNAEEYITTCSSALLAQDYPVDEHEIIMIDNDSTDASARLVDRQPRITLLHEKTPGAYAARNAGLRIARGEVIAFTDPDCAPDPEWLQHIAATMSDAAIQVALGSYTPARPLLTLSALAAYENAKNGYIFAGHNPELYYGYTNNMGARAALFREFGPFVERLRGADSIFAQRVVERYGCDAVTYVDGMRVAHLEVDSVRDYYGKVFVHARSIRELREVATLRPLSFRERLSVFGRLVKSERYNLMTAAWVFLVLSLGLAYWIVGTVRGSWPRMTRFQPR